MLTLTVTSSLYHGGCLSNTQRQPFLKDSIMGNGREYSTPGLKVQMHTYELLLLNLH